MHPYRSPPDAGLDLDARPSHAGDGGSWVGVALVVAISIGRIAIALLHAETWGVEPTVALLVVTFGAYFCRGRA